MAVKVLHIHSNDIRDEQYNRFDAKYFIVNDFFDALATKQKFEVATLESLKEQIVSGSYIDTYTAKEQGIPYLRVGDIKPFSFDENEDDFVYVSPKVDAKIKIKENDILIARTQATIDKLGTASIADVHNSGWATSQHTTRIRVKENKISPFYLLAYLNSKFFKAQTALASHGSTRVEFTHSQLNKVRVFIPEKELYNEIAEKVKTVIDYNRQALNLLEEAKAIFKKTISLKKINEKQPCFQTDLLSLKEFDIWNATCHLPFYADNEKEIKTKFKTVTLGEIANIKKGDEVGSNNYDVYINKTNTDYAFIRTSDIVNNEIDLFPDYFIPEGIYKTVNQELKTNDILFTKDGKIGQIAIVTNADKAIIASGIARIRVKKNEFNITPDYLFTVLSVKETGYNPAIRRTVIGTTIPHLREERMKQIAIPIIDKDTIQTISQKVKTAFDLKAKRKLLIDEVLNELNNEYEKYK
ncbi:MAG: restriction endonuclease subunit S [Prevotella sp.]|jgi:type I restriction enzyme S subunit|nr:restriction endonuclease subunit S [Prevotella sp.]